MIILPALKNSNGDLINNILTAEQILNIAVSPITLSFDLKKIFLSKDPKSPEILTILSQESSVSAWLDQSVDLSFDTAQSNQTKMIDLILFDTKNHENHGLAQITIVP